MSLQAHSGPTACTQLRTCLQPPGTTARPLHARLEAGAPICLSLTCAKKSPSAPVILELMDVRAEFSSVSEPSDSTSVAMRLSMNLHAWGREAGAGAAAAEAQVCEPAGGSVGELVECGRAAGPAVAVEPVADHWGTTHYARHGPAARCRRQLQRLSCRHRLCLTPQPSLPTSRMAIR
jgi:hypothetical protein